MNDNNSTLPSVGEQELQELIESLRTTFHPEPTTETWKIAGKIAGISRLGLCEEKTLLTRAIARAITTSKVTIAPDPEAEQRVAAIKERAAALEPCTCICHTLIAHCPRCSGEACRPDAASMGKRRTGRGRRSTDRRELFGAAAKERRAAAARPATQCECLLDNATGKPLRGYHENGCPLDACATQPATEAKGEHYYCDEGTDEDPTPVHRCNQPAEEAGRAEGRIADSFRMRARHLQEVIKTKTDPVEIAFMNGQASELFGAANSIGDMLAAAAAPPVPAVADSDRVKAKAVLEELRMLPDVLVRECCEGDVIGVVASALAAARLLPADSEDEEHKNSGEG